MQLCQVFANSITIITCIVSSVVDFTYNYMYVCTVDIYV